MDPTDPTPRATPPDEPLALPSPLAGEGGEHSEPGEGNTTQNIPSPAACGRCPLSQGERAEEAPGSPQAPVVDASGSLKPVRLRATPTRLLFTIAAAFL